MRNEFIVNTIGIHVKKKIHGHRIPRHLNWYAMGREKWFGDLKRFLLAGDGTVVAGFAEGLRRANRGQLRANGYP